VDACMRTRVLVALALIFGAGAAATWWYRSDHPAEVRLPAVPDVGEKESRLGDPRIYLQTDPRWVNEELGESGARMSAVGCTVCCLSMALAHHGIDLNPAQLNRALKECGGYTSRGWVKWDALRRVTKGAVRVRIPVRPTPADIERALDEGNPVIVKVLLASGIQHWVLIVGREKTEYLIKDPLGSGRTLDPLSKFPSDILAVRIVEKP